MQDSIHYNFTSIYIYIYTNSIYTGTMQIHCNFRASYNKKWMQLVGPPLEGLSPKVVVVFTIVHD